MSADTILMMANGIGVDLDAVTAADIHFPTLVEHIAKETRFNGATKGKIYNVAQHTVLGCDAMLKDGATEMEAAYFALHDLPEGLWKDDPTPKKVTIGRRIERMCGVTAEAFRGVLKAIDDEHEAAVHQAAHLPWPIPPEIKSLVKLYDLKMFVTEWRDLMGGQPHPNWSPYAGIEPLSDKIIPWPWESAAHALLGKLEQLLPVYRANRSWEKAA